MSAPVFFAAPDGTRYQVFDTAWDTEKGREVRANPPAVWATTRVFRAEDGVQRFYPLAFLAIQSNPSREPTPEHLAWQFGRSERSGSVSPRTLAERTLPTDTR